MTKLTFVEADPFYLDAVGMRCRFIYTMLNSVDNHLLFVLGRDIEWDASEEEKQIYAQYLFAGAVHIVKHIWQERGELPIIIDRAFLVDDLKRLGLSPLNWKGYQLTLTN